MALQLKNLKKNFESTLQFTIIDPPFEFSERELLEIDPKISQFCAKTRTKPLNWWTYEEITGGVGVFEKFLDRALAYFLEFLRNSAKKFHGFLGFSQGGALLDYFLFKAAQKNSELSRFLPEFVMISSPNYLGYEGDRGEWRRARVPVVLFIGELDYFFVKGVFLGTIYRDLLVVEHKEGHKIPSLNDLQVRDVEEFIRKRTSAGKKARL